MTTTNINSKKIPINKLLIKAYFLGIVLLFSSVTFENNQLSAQPPCQPTSTISSNFNGTPIAGNNYIWFSSRFKLKTSSMDPVNIFLNGSTITFAVGSTNYILNVPDAIVTFTSSVTTSSVNFNNSLQTWEVTVPLNYNGDVFLAGLAYQVPAAGFPGGINPVDWTGNFTTNDPNASLNWQWAAAVYTNFTTNYNSLGVLPVAGTYQEGTPYNYRNFVTGGARGGGGSNFTGSLSATKSVIPCSGGGVIPVDLISFNAKKINANHVELNWSTASEVNNDFFTIERTIDQENWVPVCRVNGHGNSNEINKYSCTDTTAGSAGGKTLYYRPLQVDFNGAYEYFNVIKIRLENLSIPSSVASVYPNPAFDRLNIQIVASEKGIVNIRLLSIEGKLIMNNEYKTIAGQQIMDINLPANELSKGLYVLEVESEGNIQRQKIFKQ